MSGNIVIEPIREELIPGLCDAVGAVARSGPYLRTGHGFTLEQTREFVRAILSGAGVQFVARDGEQVVGWCDVVRLTFSGMNHGGVLGIGLLESHRGQGTGNALMTATLAEARRQGISRIELEVFASNRPAIALYRRFDFVVEGVKRRARIVAGEPTDIVCMALLDW